MWNSPRVSNTDPPDVPPLAVAVLTLLDERDMHPYEMIQTLRQRQEDQWVKLRPASLYYKVDGLAERGLIEAVSTEQEGNRPPRTTYHLTDEGRAVLTAWVTAQLGIVENPYFAFSLALSDLEVIGPDDAARLLSERLTTLDERIDELRTMLAAKKGTVERIWMLAHEHRLCTLTAERDHVASLVHDIDTKALTWPSPR